MEAADLEKLVEAARAGDRGSWDALVRHHTGLLWAVAGSYRLSRADAADAVQLTWLRLVEHLGRLRNPASVGHWLVKTLRRECLRMRKEREREMLMGGEHALEQPDPGPSPETITIKAMDVQRLWAAFGQLSDQCQELLRALILAVPRLSYQEVSQALGIPMGGIGPTRKRCLEQLRRKPGTT